MRKPRLGIDGQLLLLSSILLTLPLLGWLYLEKMKDFLLDGQAEAQQLAASAVATALHNRSDLFDPSKTRRCGVTIISPCASASDGNKVDRSIDPASNKPNIPG